MGRKGFTLIELLVVGFIIGATFAFGVAKYNEFNRRQIVIQAAEELKSHLRSAQSKALAGEKDCSVCQVGGECGDGDDLTLNGWCVSFSNYGYQIYGSCGLGVDEQLFSATTVDLGSRNLEILPPPSTSQIVEVRVTASSDDAEEGSLGSMSLGSSDLELVYDGSNQTVGMRFNGLTIPQGANIVNAYVQFQVDETNSGGTSLTIQGEDVNNASTFTSSSGNISSRPRTSANVSWSPVPWTTVGEAGPNQRTPNITSVIQEIINRPGWSSGNSMVIIITGSGERTAEAYDGVSAAAPLLHVEYGTGTAPSASPICFLPLGQRVEGASTITLSGYGETREVKVSTLGEIK